MIILLIISLFTNEQSEERLMKKREEYKYFFNNGATPERKVELFYAIFIIERLLASGAVHREYITRQLRRDNGSSFNSAKFDAAWLSIQNCCYAADHTALNGRCLVPLPFKDAR